MNLFSYNTGPQQNGFTTITLISVFFSLQITVCTSLANTYGYPRSFFARNAKAYWAVVSWIIVLNGLLHAAYLGHSYSVLLVLN